jgi:hypothetical protein
LSYNDENNKFYSDFIFNKKKKSVLNYFISFSTFLMNVT